VDSWPCIAIAGPTATGKTALAAELAHLLGSEVFSADSRQVYRGLDLGTGKDLQEYRRYRPPVPYHLIDIADPEENYSLFRYQGECYSALENFRKRRGTGMPPVFCGGTGLYLESVLRRYDLAEIPANPALREELLGRDVEELKRELAERAPDLHARADLSTKRRVARALEVAMAPAGPSRDLPGWVLEPLIFVTTWDRTALRARIAARLEARLSAGLVEEVRRLRARDVSWERLDTLGMEYRQAAAYLQGKKSYENMKADLLREIHLLAKRQETWFRGMDRRGLKTVPIGPETAADALLEKYREWPGRNAG
jgi:tRNA dimethylallyltransferase